MLEDVGIPVLVGVIGAIVVAVFCTVRACRRAQAAASIQLVDLAAEVDRPDRMVSLGIAALAMYPKTG